MVENYATGELHDVTPAVFSVLDEAGRWTSSPELAEALPRLTREVIDVTVSGLLDATILEATDHARREEERALARWDGWTPAAGYFHLATKDVPYVDPVEVQEPPFSLRSYPPHLKTYEGARRLELPAFRREGPYPEVLLERRTWRSFGHRPVSLQQLSTLLGLTWGVQMWAPLEGGRRAPLKTSPSGGAKHSGEAYVLCWGVDGLERGTYHYDPDRHALNLIDAGTSPAVMETFLPGQPWFHRPPVVVVLTSVFERVHYKYRNSRAYRVVLLEAGHLAQTFCLTATWLDLAPFCTMALADSAIEEHLGLDGVSESVIYAVGVGSRPQGVRWPLKDVVGDRDEMLAPAHEKRRAAAQPEDGAADGAADP